MDSSLPEAARVFGLARHLAEAVRTAIAQDAFPVVLAGDCNSCLGTVAGCGTPGLGVVWFDAHPDFDTPDDSATGSLDAMGLAALTGRGWGALRASIPDLLPIPDRDVLLVGVRDFEPGQRERLERSDVRILEGDRFSDEQFGAALRDLRDRVGRIYVHVDLDALDPAEGIANRYSAAGGLAATRLEFLIAELFARFDVAAAALTAYDPSCDVDARMAAVATRLVRALTERVVAA